jgi:fumarate hydratase subunit beta
MQDTSKGELPVFPIHSLDLPLTAEKIRHLRAGDRVSLSGVLYTARDAAHKRLVELLDQGSPLPFPLADATIYYVGPTPAAPGQAIGSAGPTTSSRMDAYTPRLLGLGLRGMIGKGSRSPALIRAMVAAGGIYLGAIGGAGALIARSIREAEVIAFADLGPEAISRLQVENFPATVIIDRLGNNLYETGREAYLRSLG